jgi:hypothetical protein
MHCRLVFYASALFKHLICYVVAVVPSFLQRLLSHAKRKPNFALYVFVTSPRRHCLNSYLREKATQRLRQSKAGTLAERQGSGADAVN